MLVKVKFVLFHEEANVMLRADDYDAKSLACPTFYFYSSIFDAETGDPLDCSTVPNFKENCSGNGKSTFI